MNHHGDPPATSRACSSQTNSLRLATLLKPDSIENCPADMDQAVRVETRLTSPVKANGYYVALMIALGNSFGRWAEECGNGDITVPGAYEERTYTPYETIFMKTKQGADPKTLELPTKCHDGSTCSSYDNC